MQCQCPVVEAIAAAEACMDSGTRMNSYLCTVAYV